MGRKKNSGEPAAPPKTAEQKMQESRARFLRLAENRTRKAIQAIIHVGRMGNRSAYNYYDREAVAIINAIKSALEAASNALLETAPAASVFTLPGVNGESES